MRRYLILGVVVYLLVLLARFPAAVAAAWFAPDGVKAYGVTGSIWDGRAQAVSLGTTLLGESSWDLKPAWLLLGRVKADVKSRLSRSQVDARVSRFVLGSRINVSDLQGIVALTDLPATLWRNVGLQSVGGRLGLAFQSLSLDDGWPTDARGSIDIVNLDVTTQLGAAELGSFEIVFDGTGGDTLMGNLADTDSPVTLSGQLALLTGRAWRLEATAQAKPGAPADIVRALDTVGQAAPGGGARLEFGGQVP